MKTKIDFVKKVYQNSRQNLELIKKKIKRKEFTYAEKILFGHLDQEKIELQSFERGHSFLSLRPDRVAMQDATAQMALLQFMLAGKSESSVPATVHCDHLILAYKGKDFDLPEAQKENQEVFDFLSSVCSRYHLGFWKPGAGIIHQVILENYAFPGGLMIGTDSHTPNAGGLGMSAIGVGGADASDVMVGLAWEVKNPKIIGVHLKGELKGWASPKDIILYLLGRLSTKGGTDKIIEYFGEGCASISCTGKATMTNMGAELGATCSLFPYDEKMAAYLRKTEREDLADFADQNKDLLSADEDVLKNPKHYFDEIYEIDLHLLEPQIAGPHSPDLVRPLSQIKAEAIANNWPLTLSSVLIGSCTNSSYEDMGRAMSVAEQGQRMGLKMNQAFFVTPGSAQIQKTIERDGMMKVFTDIGATILANACGPCIGQWRRDDLKKGEKNSIVTSFNRNFRGRNDSHPETLSFISSPEIAMALGIAGRLDFDPDKDELETPLGKIKLKAPQAQELPEKSFIFDREGYQFPQGQTVNVSINPESKRLQELSPFPYWNGEDFIDHLILAKVKGQCTTDHISPGGPWLKYRGHLDHISDNLLLGADNAFTGEIGKGNNQLTGENSLNFAKIARYYQKAGKSWVIIGDENYGEGSSREHAAMSPRFLGASFIVCKSFARIHETNLKKQGILALTFKDPLDYDKIQETDRLSILNLANFQVGQNLRMKISRIFNSNNNNSKTKTINKKSDNNINKESETFEIELKHSYSQQQIEWFKAGSALNLIQKLTS